MCVFSIVVIMYINILPIIINNTKYISIYRSNTTEAERQREINRILHFLTCFSEKFLSWRCIQLKPWWRAFSNHQISDLIHMAMELHIIPIIAMVHHYRQAWRWARWHLLDCHMDSTQLAFHIKVCGVNIVSNYFSVA